MFSIFQNRLISFAALLLFFMLQTVHAADNILIPSPPTIVGSSYILEDFDSGKVLVEKNSNEKLARGL